jgi:hypothetical protein
MTNDRLIRGAVALAAAAFLISASMAVVWAFGRFSDWTLVRGTGPDSAAPMSPFDPDSPARIFFPRDTAQDAPYSNHMISLAYNWGWDEETGWSRSDTAKPSVALTVESWFHGLAELNFDMRPPGDLSAWPGGRVMGFAARHDGSFAMLGVGGRMFNPTGAGVTLTGGLSAAPLVLLQEGEEAADTVVRLARGDGSSSLVVRGGATPMIGLGLSGENAGQPGKGVLHFSGPIGNVPLIGVVGAGPGATLLTSQPDGEDAPVRFRIGAEGRMEWLDPHGAAMSLDARDGRLQTRGGLEAAGLRVGQQGSLIQAIRIVPADLAPSLVPGHSAHEQIFAVPGVAVGDVLFANGPMQPAEIGLAGFRIVGDDTIAIAFVNASSEAVRPSAGRYIFLAITAVY